MDPLVTALEETLLRYGVVGASIGIFRGKMNQFYDIGLRRIGSTQKPGQHTVYLISSMTKPIVALSMFILVNDEKYNVTIDTPVSDILEKLEQSSGNSLRHLEGRKLRISDLLDLRSEFHKSTNLWESPGGDIPWQTIDPMLSLLCHMPSNESFGTRDSFVNQRNYVNECFALAGDIIEKITKTPWPEFVREKIFVPLQMKNTWTNTSQRGSRVGVVPSYSVLVHETFDDLRDQTPETALSYQHVKSFVERGAFISPKPIEVKRSKVCSLGRTPLKAAAGITSTTSDLLKLSKKFIEVYHKLSDNDMTDELERGIAAMLKYIGEQSEDRTYAAGFNRVLLPWDPTQANSKTRWPGADGDNVRRLQTAMQNDNELTCQSAWPFFVDAPINTKKASDNLPSQPGLYHGGNMIGATSFWFMLPEKNVSVVVLCNTRGFFLDLANLACMSIAHCMFHTQDSDKSLTSAPFKDLVKDMVSKVKDTAKRIATSYLWEVARYEACLATEYPEYADAWIYSGCIGTYLFCEGIFVTVSKTAESPRLEFHLYRQDFKYPLRVNAKESSAERPVMTFAMPMKDLIPTGVGGSNRLKVSDFKVVFDEKDSSGKFGQLHWNFASFQAVWKRVGDAIISS